MKPLKRVLWVIGRMPSPLFTGDALYSAALLKALAATGEAAITVLGASREDHAMDSSQFELPGINFVTVPKPLDIGPLSYFAPLPRDAYWLTTGPFRKALEKLLKNEWDWIVIDHARSAAFLRQVLKHRRQASICHVAHNAEGKVRPEIAKKMRHPLHRMVTRFDAWKYRRMENRVAGAADRIICITDADAAYFSQFKKSIFVVPPIYLGTIRPPQLIDSTRPKSIVLVGSFYWIAKQLNLARIIRDLVPSLNQNGISLEVVGNVPENIRNLYIGESPNLVFHGPVADLPDLLAKSRGGLVAEELGGGFKLKLLDYIFARLPVFGLKLSVEGTTAQEQSAMFLAEDMGRLAQTIVEKIDDLGSLNSSQSSLFEFVSDRFGLEQGIDRIRRVFLDGHA